MAETSIGFLFPGQGSQSTGMLKDLAAAFPSVEDTFQEASDALGFDLWDLVQSSPAEQLNQTRNTQPAMLAAGVAVWRVWNEQGGPIPDLMAGHSLGEYSALVCAGALKFADTVGLVAHRGRLMQEAVPEGVGAMAAVLGLDDEKVRELCTAAARSEIVEAVNFNAPGQVVIAGHRSAVERALALAKSAGAKRAVALPVSVPSHCALMQPAAEKLGVRLDTIPVGSPGIPVLHNVTVGEAETPATIRQLLTRQLYSPVRWAESVLELKRRGITSLVECGPGKVLTALNRRIDRSMKGMAVFDPPSLRSTLETLE